MVSPPVFQDNIVSSKVGPKGLATMSKIESPSTPRRPVVKTQPRHPHREIAELLATAILRLRANPHDFPHQESSMVCLAITGDQSVHTNPSYQ
jgi:hypothetical protein